MTSIPGFKNYEGESFSSDDATKKTELTIKSGCEWRFEVPFKTILILKVLEGIGEIFGTELPLNVEIRLSGVKYALYAPEEGCKVEYYLVPNKDQANFSSEDEEVSEYIGEETPMDIYRRLHFALHIQRINSASGALSDANRRPTGPRVLILGNQYSGKTSLAKILISYATKMDTMPVLVNLNPRDGVFSLPGSITATPINDSLDLESVGGWGSSPTSGVLFHNPKQPLVKSYGFTNYKSNVELFKYQVSKLGIAVMSKLEEDSIIRDSGLIIDTPAFTTKDFNIIENIVSDFEVNVIVVVGNERLLVDLKKKFRHKASKSNLDFVKVPKSGGVVEVDDSYIRKIQEETIKEYFNGNFRNVLSPFKTELDVKEFVIYSSLESRTVDAGLQFLPSVDSYTADDDDASTSSSKKDDLNLDNYYMILKEPSASNLENTIIAITQTPQNISLGKELLNSCVLGYAHVSKVDDTKNRMKVLLPYQGTVPRNILIATGVRYVE